MERTLDGRIPPVTCLKNSIGGNETLFDTAIDLALKLFWKEIRFGSCCNSNGDSNRDKIKDEFFI